MSRVNTIDKYGRKMERTDFTRIRGPPSVGFILAHDGNYNISGKMMCHLGEPLTSDDRATREYVDRNLALHDQNIKKEIQDTARQLLAALTLRAKQYIDSDLSVKINELCNENK